LSKSLDPSEQVLLEVQRVERSFLGLRIVVRSNVIPEEGEQVLLEVQGVERIPLRLRIFLLVIFVQVVLSRGQQLRQVYPVALPWSN